MIALERELLALQRLLRRSRWHMRQADKLMTRIEALPIMPGDLSSVAIAGSVSLHRSNVMSQSARIVVVGYLVLALDRWQGRRR